MTDDDLDKIVFIYNGIEEIEANRKNVASSCIYFHCLLQGSFKEAKEKRISIQMEDFSFRAFESIINYADTKNFDNKLKFSHYVEVIQLAAVWLFDELVQLIELHLIEYINLDRITTLHTLANFMDLPELLKECLAFEKILDAGGTLNKNWGRCPIPGHQNHHYQNCSSDRFGQEEDWDREPDSPTATLTEEESIRLAIYREEVNSYEYINTRRYFKRKLYR